MNPDVSVSLIDTIDIVPTPVVIVDDSGIMVRGNPALFELLGYAPEEFIGRSFMIVIPDALRERAIRMFPTNLEAETLAPIVEWELLRADGTVVSVHVKPGRFRSEDGRWLVVWALTDTSEVVALQRTRRLLTESRTRLDESEARYRLLVESSPHSVAIFDDWIIQFGNSAMAEMLGFSDPAELIGLDSRRFIADGDLSRVTSYQAKRFSPDGAPERYEFEGRRRDGSRFWASCRVVVVRWNARRMSLATTSDITEQRIIENSLRRSRDLFQSVFESSADALFLIDGATRLVADCNQRAVALFDLDDKSEIIGTTGKSLRQREFTPAEVDEIEYYRRTGLPHSTEVEYTTRKGRHFWGNLAFSRVEVAGETLIVVRVTDITDQKRAEAALRLSEEQFRQAFTHSGMGMAVSAMDGTFTRVNRKFAEFLGYAEAELEGMNFRRVTHPDDIGTDLALANRLRSREIEVFELEKRYVQKSGQLVWGRLTGSLVRDEQGAPLHLIAQIQDITERRRLTAELREREALLRAFYDSVPFRMGVFELLDEENDIRFVSVNAAWTRRWGAPPEVAAGRRATEIGGSREFIDPIVRHIRLARDSGSPATWESFDTETNQWTRGSIARFDTPPGAPPRFCFVVWDVTRQREIEEERIRSSKLDALAVLAGGIAHDFNNLLTMMLGYVGLAKAHIGDPPRAAAKLDKVDDAIGRARTLSQQLLTFARGGAPIRQMTDLGELLRETVGFSLLGSPCQEEVTVPSDLDWVEVDRGQIQQVIQNLVLNARDAMPEGGHLFVEAANVSLDEPGDLPAGDYVRIRVRDTGSGIPAEHLAKVFDPYFTTKQTGTGLGLAVSYSIVKRHGGQITVASTPNEGTTFEIHLPATVRRPAVPDSPRAVPLESRGARRVLVMDDEPLVREMLRELLEDLGYVVIDVGDGGEAEASFREALDRADRFDAVILDLTVPGGVGGVETLKRLKRIDPEVRAIVCSGYSDDPVLADPAAYGFRARLKKPFSSAELSSALSAIVS